VDVDVRPAGPARRHVRPGPPQPPAVHVHRRAGPHDLPRVGRHRRRAGGQPAPRTPTARR
jgi:hypothetical protein